MTNNKRTQPARRNMAKESRISLPALLAYNATPQASKLVVKYGEAPPTSHKDLKIKLSKVIAKFKGQALKDVAEIHPDRNLILSSSSNRMDGVDRGDGYYYHNSDGGGTNFRPYMDNPPIGWMQGTGMNTSMLDWGNVDYYRAANGARLSINTKKILGTGAVILGVVAFGALLVAFGERRRSYQNFAG